MTQISLWSKINLPKNKHVDPNVSPLYLLASKLCNFFVDTIIYVRDKTCISSYSFYIFWFLEHSSNDKHVTNTDRQTGKAFKYFNRKIELTDCVFVCVCILMLTMKKYQHRKGCLMIRNILVGLYWKSDDSPFEIY